MAYRAGMNRAPTTFPYLLFIGFHIGLREFLPLLKPGIGNLYFGQRLQHFLLQIVQAGLQLFQFLQKQLFFQFRETEWRCMIMIVRHHDSTWLRACRRIRDGCGYRQTMAEPYPPCRLNRKEGFPAIQDRHPEQSSIFPSRKLHHGRSITHDSGNNPPSRKEKADD